MSRTQKTMLCEKCGKRMVCEGYCQKLCHPPIVIELMRCGCGHNAERTLPQEKSWMQRWREANEIPGGLVIDETPRTGDQTQ